MYEISLRPLFSFSINFTLLASLVHWDCYISSTSFTSSFNMFVSLFDCGPGFCKANSLNIHCNSIFRLHYLVKIVCVCACLYVCVCVCVYNSLEVFFSDKHYENWINPESLHLKKLKAWRILIALKR